MRFLNVPLFLIALSVGLFVTYISGPETNTIFVYPNPDNINKINYRDNADTCFKFSAQEVKCPEDKKKIRSYNVQ
jgi:hypothetical protein